MTFAVFHAEGNMPVVNGMLKIWHKGNAMDGASQGLEDSVGDAVGTRCLARRKLLQMTPDSGSCGDDGREKS